MLLLFIDGLKINKLDLIKNLVGRGRDGDSRGVYLPSKVFIRWKNRCTKYKTNIWAQSVSNPVY